MKQVTKKMNKLLDEGDKGAAEELLPELMRIADKAASKGPIHQNKASRIKSKYAKRVQSLS